ncbi:hypothetical protein FOMPIDRAFT_1040360 [Fomitopsis schrenkii]|uniref:Uncharacterized protein n=1 Tax=Fomitopsis schrenkii TaxID=2126942 RepID=S8FZM5_FOMSC|nr:hypothetical protein FOMPIDRAFT_1040360 [Fomitopsis schrenkii]
MIDITWDTPEASDHGRKASTIHGWVTKLRGTLIDDERIRKRGIREMQYARRLREWKKEKGVTDQGTSLPAFSFLPSKPPQPNNQVAIVRRHTTGGASHQTTLPEGSIISKRPTAQRRAALVAATKWAAGQGWHKDQQALFGWAPLGAFLPFLASPPSVAEHASGVYAPSQWASRPLAEQATGIVF